MAERAAIAIELGGVPLDVEITARDSQAANKALELLGKHLGLFIDRAEIASVDDFTHLTDQELAAELKSTVAGLVGGDLSPECTYSRAVRSVEWWTCEQSIPLEALMDGMDHKTRWLFMGSRWDHGRTRPA